MHSICHCHVILLWDLMKKYICSWSNLWRVVSFHKMNLIFYIKNTLYDPEHHWACAWTSCCSWYSIFNRTYSISKYIDLHIKELVCHLPSFVEDTTDFLNKMKSVESLQNVDLLCTMDVTSLYTNVPHAEGLDALRHFLNQREVCSPPTDFFG